MGISVFCFIFMPTDVNAWDFPGPTWKIFLNLLILLVKCGFPAQMMSSTNRITTISVWLRKVNSPWSNCDCTAPSFQSSSQTFKYQYREASANPYTHLFNFQILFVCASLGACTKTLLSKFLRFEKAVLTSIEFIVYFFDAMRLNAHLNPSLEHVGLSVR